jgi:hypothetical protein
MTSQPGSWARKPAISAGKRTASFSVGMMTEIMEPPRPCTSAQAPTGGRRLQAE